MSTSSSARAILSQAQKKASSASSSFSFFSSSSTRYEEAAELYVEAAVLFRAESDWASAAQAYTTAAEISLKHLQNKQEAAQRYWDAAKAWKKTDSMAACTALSHVVDLYVSIGRFRQAADRQKEMATVLKDDASDPSQAILAFERAAQWYADEEAIATAIPCWREAAELSAYQHDYRKSADLYEAVAKHSLDSGLLKYSVRDYYLRAGLCHIASTVCLTL